MRLVYLSTPYSHPEQLVRNQRADLALQLTVKLTTDDTAIYSPIVSNHPVALLGGLPGSYLYWQYMDEKFIRACDELWVATLPGYKQSKGILAEVAFARSWGREVTQVLTHNYGLPCDCMSCDSFVGGSDALDS